MRPTLRAAAVGLLGILGWAGLPQEAPAFQFNNGDLVLAIFGNNTEFYYDIGTHTNLLTPGMQTTVEIGSLPGSPFAPGSGVVGGGEQTQWTIIGRNPVPATPAANGIFTFAGSQNNAAGITTTPAISPYNSEVQGWNSLLLASTGATPAGPGAQTFLPSSDPAAFTNPNTFGLGGTLGGHWNQGFMQGALDATLNIIQGRARNELGQTNVLSDVGRAILTAGGQLTICGGGGCTPTAIPVPAAVILFASGLVGLAGIARRGWTNTSA